MGDKYVWQPRQRGGDKAICRLISISPKYINRYYLRLLLCYRRGPRSFEELKTVDGVVMETYKTAALSLGFLESDEESHRCLLKASCQMINNLQTIPVNNRFFVVQSIWHSEIYMNIYSQTGKIWKYATDVAFRERNRLLEAETSCNPDELTASVDSPGGTGKSFLLEKLLAYVRQKGCVALAVAGRGIAAQLLIGGKTAHSTFELPLERHGTSTCDIGSRSFEAALLKRTNTIV
ncbi:hypothetical protein PHMEG_00023843 [Phytophthora megakarya]|uniref:ATP-dependent DNA helicase n=1 Tax=Phytophthora megakarya TaxID=4795 RepID=A0A225VH32_9STRA|nr:hypothetical protein PHMEG_00023843 [Phytophthora megakarya]